VSACVALLPVAMVRASVMAESDSFWEIRTGQLILQTGHIPAVDTFSWWAFGRPWAPDSWAFDVLLALAYRGGGLRLVAVAGAAAVLAIGAAVLLVARRLGAAPVVACVLVTAWMLVAIGWLSVRPQLVDYLAVPLILLVAGDNRLYGRIQSRRLVLVSLIFAAWVNLHAAAPIGVVVLLAYGAGELLGRRQVAHAQLRSPQAIFKALLPALAGLIGLVINPQGLDLFRQVQRTALSSASLITEWGHVSLSNPGQLLMLGAGVLGIVAAARRHRWDLAIVLGTLAIGSITLIRLLPILDVVALPVLAADASLCAAGRESRNALRAVAVGLIGVLAVEAAVDVPRIGEASLPVQSVSALPAGCRLFNEYLLGGIVILLRPDVPVSMDSRNDLYGRDDVLYQQQLLSNTKGGADTLDQLAVNCVLIPQNAGLAGQLSVSADWERVRSDPGATVFIRRKL
jgi:hypothetical protein